MLVFPSGIATDASSAQLFEENVMLRAQLAEMEDRHFHERAALEDECERLRAVVAMHEAAE